MIYNENDFRDLFVGVDDYVPLKSGKKVIPINFDNAATTPALKSVEYTVNEYLKYYGSIGRGTGIKSCKCTSFYEESREIILDFLNIKNKSKYTVIYVKNATEGINLLANALIDSKEDILLTTRMEHHANDLPWRKVANVVYVDVNKGGEISIDDIEAAFIKYKGKIKFLSITGASNVTGFVNPINKVATIAHKYGAKIIVDAAQLIAHEPIKMEGNKGDDYIDFLVFSAHKAYAPFGAGAVIGIKEDLDEKEPLLRGGGSIDMVLDNEVYFYEAPARFESGTPNFLGVVAMATALKTIKKLDFEKIVKYESRLKDYFLAELLKIPEIRLYGNTEVAHRLALLVMNIEGIHHDDLAKKLSDLRAIAVRQGTFCAHPYANRLLGVSDADCYKYINDPKIPRPGMIRASLSIYNNFDEINEFLNLIEYIIGERKY